MSEDATLQSTVTLINRRSRKRQYIPGERAEYVLEGDDLQRSEAPNTEPVSASGALLGSNCSSPPPQTEANTRRRLLNTYATNNNAPLATRQLVLPVQPVPIPNHRPSFLDDHPEHNKSESVPVQSSSQSRTQQPDHREEEFLTQAIEQRGANLSPINDYQDRVDFNANATVRVTLEHEARLAPLASSIREMHGALTDLLPPLSKTRAGVSKAKCLAYRFRGRVVDHYPQKYEEFVILKCSSCGTQ